MKKEVEHEMEAGIIQGLITVNNGLQHVDPGPLNAKP